MNLKSLELPTRRANPNFTFTGSYKKRVHVRGMRESLACATCLYQRQHLRGLITTFPAFSLLNTQQIYLVHIQIVCFLYQHAVEFASQRDCFIYVIILRGHCVTHNTHNLVVNLLGDAIMGGFNGGGRQLFRSLQYFPTIQKTSKY